MRPSIRHPAKTPVSDRQDERTRPLAATFSRNPGLPVSTNRHENIPNVSSVTNRNKNSALPGNTPSCAYTLLNHEKRPSTPAVAGVFLSPRPAQTRRHTEPAQPGTTPQTQHNRTGDNPVTAYPPAPQRLAHPSQPHFHPATKHPPCPPPTAAQPRKCIKCIDCNEP